MSYMDVVSVASDVLLPQHLCVLTLESHSLSSASFVFSELFLNVALLLFVLGSVTQSSFIIVIFTFCSC